MYSVTIRNMTSSFLSQIKNSNTISSNISTVSLRSSSSLGLMTQQSCQQALVCRSRHPKTRLDTQNKHLAHHLVLRIQQAYKIMW
jgi:hypothetical protein